jgi:hypothetical protein
MNWKQRIGYIWDYYKLWIFGGIIVALLLGAAFHSALTIHKDIYLQITLVNADSITVEDSTLFDDFEKKYCDTKFEKLEVASNIKLKQNDTGAYSGSGYQVLSAQLLAGEIDAFIADKDTLLYLADTDCFVSLKELLSDQELEQYKDYLVYAKDSKTNETYPVGISLDASQLFAGKHYYQESAVIGVPALSKQSENAVKLIEYLLGSSTVQ